MEWTAKLSITELDFMASMLKDERILCGTSQSNLTKYFPQCDCPAIAHGLNQLAGLGFSNKQAAVLLEHVKNDRISKPDIDKIMELVTSGPDINFIPNRDTGVVVRELFSHAKKSVLVAGYAVYQGATIFHALAERMEECHDLSVKMFLDIKREKDNHKIGSEMELWFVNHFRQFQWPAGKPLPDIYYSPDSLIDDNKGKKACLHAKVVVVDDEKVLVTSANFTEAAQERNIEVGLSLTNANMAKKIRDFFDQLAQKGHCKKILDGRSGAKAH
jgi:phosphatidylserine/phosphatidylglycerophosphate/cardiolipin synthase-like enzyme